MRTFHIGGAATRGSEENRIYLRHPVVVRGVTGHTVDLPDGTKLFTRKGKVGVARVIQRVEAEKGERIRVKHDDTVDKGTLILKRGDLELRAEDNAYAVVKDRTVLLVTQEQKVEVRAGAQLVVKEGEVVEPEESLATFDPFSEPIISEVEGVVVLKDIVQGTTLKEEINEDTGKIEKKITEFTLESLHPRIVIQGQDGSELATHFLPGNAYLNVEDGEEVKPGRTLAKLLRESAKTADITGGLPRVGELFEARKPKSPAVLSQISGVVGFKTITKGKRVITVTDAYGVEYKHLVPMGKHLLVREGDEIEAGDMLCEGTIDPHEVLQILGENALQRFLVNEVQEVYRLQGVDINDKHIGVIIRQMMRKVEIVQVGDTNFIFGQQIDKSRFHEVNRKVMNEGGQPAVGRPLLLGITRASLNIDSFISAASFQETTRVLTNAAISGSADNLRGLKENVIIGHLIPAGTGMRSYRNIRLYDEHRDDLDAHMQQIVEQRERERSEQQEEEQTEEAEVYET